MRSYARQRAGRKSPAIYLWRSHLFMPWEIVCSPGRAVRRVRQHNTHTVPVWCLTKPQEQELYFTLLLWLLYVPLHWWCHVKEACYLIGLGLYVRWSRVPLLMHHFSELFFLRSEVCFLSRGALSVILVQYGHVGNSAVLGWPWLDVRCQPKTFYCSPSSARQRREKIEQNTHGLR